MIPITVRLLRPVQTFMILATLFASRAMATVPPEREELNRDKMVNLGFKFKLQRNETRSWIKLNFPATLHVNNFLFSPHMTTVVIKDSSGYEIANTDNWIENNEFRSINTSYRQLDSDIAISVEYTCKSDDKNGCFGAKIFEIPSVSKFFDSNPDFVNLPPKCKKISSVIYDCTGEAKPRDSTGAKQHR